MPAKCGNYAASAVEFLQLSPFYRPTLSGQLQAICTSHHSLLVLVCRLACKPDTKQLAPSQQTESSACLETFTQRNKATDPKQGHEQARLADISSAVVISTMFSQAFARDHAPEEQATQWLKHHNNCRWRCQCASDKNKTIEWGHRRSQEPVSAAFL